MRPKSPAPLRRFGAVFVLPLAALLWAGSVGADAGATGAELFLVTVVCSASGVAWQVLHRRDLVDRLTHFAVAFWVLGVFFFLIAWQSGVTSSIGLGVGLSAVLTGCVFAEQWLRVRDVRRARRAEPARA